ncbi:MULTISPECIES: L-valine transporter subunit YgaH [Brenneria]|uniref:L-valine transporter subunit YgaH n=1 Tax=Brenneria nigrifluens DSM 30175 = ATCC 13028 TaxID=1121120 RepID=A0A2U1UK50_9GAMM|nr:MULTISPECIES: L-valine transporter subunit YgaH [Brenneria]EHD20335.1 Protein of unknown function DUF2598 [Brenneria sp. EniD312]PWC22017.1 L-valine transporter subunit YgaH [Brenneria nigrifluens DSM 30175 = ATCC 13028]QCR03545.1 L-valine transporter subunit YgaH [Brenneria nigrifluens DSM 30175 = ATCC 13028]
MSTQIILIGLLVGLINYLFRYLPLCLDSSRACGSLQRGRTALLLDSIGIASICALLIVSSVPDILRHGEKLLPTLVGFATLTVGFYKSRSIVFSTLLGAFCYGVAIKLF